LNQLEPEVQIELYDIKLSIKAELQSTFEAAEAAPFPAASEAYQDVYA
jgi:TPP-dependent pyruvate/acetoin dehydrogenase alpha subunit